MPHDYFGHSRTTAFVQVNDFDPVPQSLRRSKAENFVEPQIVELRAVVDSCVRRDYPRRRRRFLYFAGYSWETRKF